MTLGLPLNKYSKVVVQSIGIRAVGRPKASKKC
uniref:Uncharacterized protein n=1 Tax=Lepeophtheirus salmonis TaxID=72036 RepID=A0A0K2SWD3_LEPSM